jgi:hypothetical protein
MKQDSAEQTIPTKALTKIALTINPYCKGAVNQFTNSIMAIPDSFPT